MSKGKAPGPKAKAMNNTAPRVVKAATSSRDLLRKVRKPLPMERFRRMVNEGPLDRSLWSTVLSISKASLEQRMRNRVALVPAEVERVVLMNELVDRGTEVFGERERFLLWLNMTNAAMRGERPVVLLGSATGIAMVMDELVSIEHGLPA